MKSIRSLYYGFDTESNTINIGSLVEAILLFNSVYLPSSNNIQTLINSFGAHGTLLLFSEGNLAIAGGYPSAQGTYDYLSPGFFKGRPLNKPLRYGFETIYADPSHPKNPTVQQRIARDVLQTNCSISEKEKLVEQLSKSLREIDPSNLRTVDDFRADISRTDDLIRQLFLSTIKDELQKQKIIEDKISFSIREISDSIFEVRTNLGYHLGMKKDQLHEFLKRPFFGITGTNLQLHRMHEVGAASGLTPLQMNVISNKVDFLSKVHLDLDLRAEFTRTKEISEIPILSNDAKVNIDGLLKLRNSDEARVFRDWLHTSSNMSNKEISELVSDWRRKLSQTLKTSNVRILRGIFSNGVGSFEPVSGTILSIFDLFVERVLPNIGPIGFLTGEYKDFIKKQNNSKKQKET